MEKHAATQQKIESGIIFRLKLKHLQTVPSTAPIIFSEIIFKSNHFAFLGIVAGVDFAFKPWPGLVGLFSYSRTYFLINDKIKSTAGRLHFLFKLLF